MVRETTTHKTIIHGKLIEKKKKYLEKFSETEFKTIFFRLSPVKFVPFFSPPFLILGWALAVEEFRKYKLIYWVKGEMMKHGKNYM